jgi:hypothetical protein
MNWAALLLVSAVASVGVLHTLVPDHWLPIALLARERGWSKAETARAALQAGTGHVLSTLAIGIAVWTAGIAVAGRFGHLVDIASSLALIGFGVWIALSAWGELDHDDGPVHAHRHQAIDPVAHAHGHSAGGKTRWHRFFPGPGREEPAGPADTAGAAAAMSLTIKTDPLYARLRGAPVLARHAHIHRHGRHSAHLHWHDHAAATAHPVLADFAANPPWHRHRHKTTARAAMLLILGSSPMVEGLPAFFAAAKYGAPLLAVMAAVFAASTITTYVVVCTVWRAGLQHLRLGAVERYGEVLSGAVIAAVGIVFGLWPAL